MFKVLGSTPSRQKTQQSKNNLSRNMEGAGEKKRVLVTLIIQRKSSLSLGQGHLLLENGWVLVFKATTLEEHLVLPRKVVLNMKNICFEELYLISDQERAETYFTLEFHHQQQEAFQIMVQTLGNLPKLPDLNPNPQP